MSRPFVHAVERRMRLLFDSTVVRFGKVTGGVGSASMDAGKHVITLVDGYDDYYTLQVLFHELAHLALPGELSAFGDWDEEILERVVEPNLMHWITGRPKIHAWWLKRLTALRGAK